MSSKVLPTASHADCITVFRHVARRVGDSSAMASDSPGYQGYFHVSLHIKEFVTQAVLEVMMTIPIEQLESLLQMRRQEGH